MFFYQTKDRLPFAEIAEKTTLLFEKFVVGETTNS
jgi:hypothetical protein